MARLLIYGLLLFAVALTAFLFVSQSSDVPDTVQIAAPRSENLPAELPSQTIPPPAEPQAAPPALSLRDEPVIPVQTAGESAQKRQDRELAANAAEKFRAGDYEAALSLYKELSERDNGALAGIGMSCFKLGDIENARTFLERAVEHNPSDFNARKILAFVYYRKNDPERGLSHAKAGLALNRDPELQRLYEKLAKETSSQDTSLSESSEHFRITFDGHKHGTVSRKVIEILEDAYGSVGREFGHFPSEPVTAVLQTGKDFADITRAPGWAGGVYDGKIRIPVRGAETNEPLLRKVLFHEYTHSVVHSLTPRCPLWINEGLAEYFSAGYQRKTRQLIPLRSLERSFSWLSGQEVGIAYWESYSAVAHLIERHGFYRMKEFLLSLSRETGLEQAFKDSFGVSYSEFVSSWGKG
jgi:tetratricopeptide (TPR) repeat protein